MKWVKKALSIFKRVVDITFYNKNELKILFRKMMIQGLD